MPAVACLHPLDWKCHVDLDPLALPESDTYRTNPSSTRRSLFLGTELVGFVMDPVELVALMQFELCLVSGEVRLSYLDLPPLWPVLGPCCSYSLGRSSRTALYLFVAGLVDGSQDFGLTLLFLSSHYCQRLERLVVCHSPGAESEGTCFCSSQVVRFVPVRLGL